MSSAPTLAIVSSRWNALIVDQLLHGALTTLSEAGVAVDQIVRVEVPGAYEIPQACAAVIKCHQLDAVITLGCVIRGETPHFDYVAGECARGVTDVALATGVPITLGVLTCDDSAQALARSGGDQHNKGREAAAAALQMIDAWRTLT